MDPLSIIASCITLAEAAAKIGTAISRLRHFGEVPGKIYALRNEISDLEVVLRQTGQALKESVLATDEDASLVQILGRTKGHLTDLSQALERIATTCAQRKIKVIAKSTIWYKEKAVFQGFRHDVLSVKTSLTLILGAANSQQLKYIILELQKVTVETAKSGQFGQVIDQGIAHRQSALSSRMDSQHEALKDRIEALGQTLLDQRLQGTEAEKLQQLATLSRERGDTVRVLTSHRLPCRNWCPCVCHTRRKMSLASPGLVEGVLGRVFIGYSGLPMQRQECDFKGCHDKQQAAASVEYWFPSWFVSMNLKLHLTYQPMAGPELQLSTTRRVPDSSQSISFAMQGNIEGLKHLFINGLAGPRDVSNSRGYTLLRWALYGGMHNFQTVQFLIREGALVDEESYGNVWDFVFRGKCTEKQQAELRCITEGGEGDWVEEQNFPLVHRIIFGLSKKPLASELEENPRAIYLTDTQNRTALDWATARSQLQDMETLTVHGASPNNMDVTGRTPVLHAVDTHDVETLRSILKHGGDPNPKYPKGMFRSSPLTAAGFAGMSTLLKLLLDYEADPNACNPEGLTALHSIARTHNADCAQLLLEYGADLHATSDRGQTPLMVAIVNNNYPILNLFVNHGSEYMTSHTSKGPQMLPFIAEHADVQTLGILSAAHPLRMTYDISWSNIKASRELLEQRQDYNDKLGDAFEDFIAVIRSEDEKLKSLDGQLEDGLFLSARSSFHSDLAEAMSSLNSPTLHFADSDNSEEEWADTREQPGSSAPSSPQVIDRSRGSPTSPRGRQFRWPPTVRDDGRTVATPSPLKRQVSR